MREEVLSQVPRTLSKDSIVLVIGAPGDAGQRSLIKEIRDFNSKEEWIRWEERADAPTSVVSSGIALVIALSGVKSAALVNMRTAAEKQSIPFIRMPLTVGEARAVLTQLSIAREGKPAEEAVFQAVASIARASGVNEPHGSNGNGVNGSSASRFEAPAESASNEDRAFDEALEAIEAFQKATDRVLQAIFAVTEERRKAKAQDAESEAKLSEKDEELVRLRQENERLRTESASYKNTLGCLEGILKKETGR